MKLAECRELKKGDKLIMRTNVGWSQVVSFKGLHQVTRLGCPTNNKNLMELKIEDLEAMMDTAKTFWQVWVEYVDDWGKHQTSHVMPRALMRCE